MMIIRSKLPAILIGLILGWWAVSVRAQTSPWQEVWQETANEEDENPEEAFDLLQELSEHPLDLNTATRDELEQLPFLSAQQVMALLEYRDRIGIIRSMGELRLVATLDWRQLELLPFFVVINPETATESQPALSELLRRGRHELTASGRIPFHDRRGYHNGYLGSRYRHWLRYEYVSQNRIRAGLVGAKESGEPFFKGGNRWGYDAYNLYIQLQKIGAIENLVAGRFKLSTGMGLVVNNQLSMGKMASLSSQGRLSHTLRTHRSRSEAGSFNGVAGTIRLGKALKTTLFVSHQAIDATLNSQDEAQTIVTSGYHRTDTEMAKKHNTRETDAGLNVSYRQEGLNIGLTTLYTHLNRRLSPQTSTLYRRYYPQGRNFLNASVDYGLTLHRLAFRGETAIDQQGHLAFLHSLSLKPADALTVMALHRRYSYRYNSMHGRSFGENSRPQNEQGFFLGVTWQTLRQLQLTAYADVVSFPWAHYRVSRPSSAQDFLTEAIYEPHRNWTIRGRYRLHRKQQDNDQKSALVWHNEHRSRFSIAYKGTPWGAKTQLDLTQSVSEEAAKGWMLSQQLDWKRQKWQLSGTAGYFQTDSYEARIYVFERQLTDEFAFPMYYGRGIRLAGLAKAHVSQWLELSAKIGYTRYNDRKSIGTDLQETGTPWLSDLDFQLRIKL